MRLVGRALKMRPKPSALSAVTAARLAAPPPNTRAVRRPASSPRPTAARRVLTATLWRFSPRNIPSSSRTTQSTDPTLFASSPSWGKIGTTACPQLPLITAPPTEASERRRRNSSTVSTLSSRLAWPTALPVKAPRSTAARSLGSSAFQGPMTGNCLPSLKIDSVLRNRSSSSTVRRPRSAGGVSSGRVAGQSTLLSRHESLPSLPAQRPTKAAPAGTAALPM
mmetsp:Transcript_122665/g.381872  ORF Transcript_122665/g.381872 Transcript_122665/m.381872 type:complete len:223 (-) Transcript_122665:20-688(-)